jgi:quinol monooxygenase YgiN
MAMLTISTVLLSVRGTVIPPTRDALRELHNRTAGSAEGVAAARALGDLSHKVFTPVPGVPGANDRELLFLDVWCDAEGVGSFFSDAHVQQGGSLLFSERDAVLWRPFVGSFGFELDAPTDMTSRYLGIVRGPIGDPSVTIDTFSKVMNDNLAAARQRGQLSHQLYSKLTQPGEQAEVLGVDLWCDAAGMQAHYSELTGYEQAFTAQPATSVWEAATGGSWTEW